MRNGTRGHPIHEATSRAVRRGRQATGLLTFRGVYLKATYTAAVVFKDTTINKKNIKTSPEIAQKSCLVATCTTLMSIPT